MIDTHAHLVDKLFDEDRAEVISIAKEKGIKGIISVCENLAEGEKNLELADQHPEIFPAVGLYPAILDLNQALEIVEFIHRHHQRLACIGEVGLDYWLAKTEEEKEIQRRIFKRFIELSCELNLPLNVHSRSAGRHAISFLIENGAKKVQLHAFDGKAASAQPAIEAGYFFSIPPSIVRSTQKQKLVKRLPMSSILVESDSPVLGPNKDARNEPANILLAIDAISQLKEINREEIIENVNHNSAELYGSEIMKQI